MSAVKIGKAELYVSAYIDNPMGIVSYQAMHEINLEIAKLEAERDEHIKAASAMAAIQCVHSEKLGCDREGVFCKLKEPERKGYGE